MKKLFLIPFLLLAGCGYEAGEAPEQGAFNSSAPLQTEDADYPIITAAYISAIVHPYRIECEGDFCDEVRVAAQHWNDLTGIQFFTDEAELPVSLVLGDAKGDCARTVRYESEECVITYDPSECPDQLPLITIGHELGHCIGLGHTGDNASIMYPFPHNYSDITEANVDWLLEHFEATHE